MFGNKTVSGSAIFTIYSAASVKNKITLLYLICCNCLVTNITKWCFSIGLKRTIFENSSTYCKSFALVLCIFSILNDKSQNEFDSQTTRNTLTIQDDDYVKTHTNFEL